MPENRQYLIEIPGMEGADMWDADRWERNKDRLLADHKDTNVFEVEAYNPWDEKENDQYLISMPGMEGSDVWDSERWQRNKEAFMKENPQAVVERVRYVDYWGDAAKQNRERRKELDQPDAERDARLAQIGYFDDLSGEQKTFDMNSPAMVGLKPLSSAVKQNSVSGETEYLDPKVAEFYANDTAYTDRLAEKARLDAEYESNPSVIAQREYEAELARYAAKLEEEIKSDMESDIDTGKFARGFARKNMPGTATAYATSGSLSKDTIGESLENEKYERYSTAVKLLEKAKIARNVAGKGFGGAVIDWAKEGFMDKTTQSDVEAYNEIGNILSRIEKEVGSLKAENITEEVFDKYLSKDEQALIKAFFEYNSAMAEAQQDMSGWYKGGKIFAESVPFMLEFLATGGLYKAAGRASTRGLEKALVKWITKSTGKSVASVGRKVLGSNAIGFTRALAGTGARTLVSPGTYDRMAEASIEIDDEGHLHRAKNAAIGFADMYVENLSEISGGLIGKGLGYLGKGAGSLAKTLGGAPLAKFGSWLGDQKLVQGLVKGWSAAAPKLERLGFHGLPEEIGEEFIGNTIREFGIQPGALEEMVSDDNFGAMLIGFAPMTLLGAAGGAISIGVVNAKASKLGEELRQMFSSHHDTKEIDSIMQSLSGATTAKEIKEMLKPMEASVMNALSRGMITREQAIEEIEMLYQYGGFIAQNNALLFGQQARENELATAKRAEMADRYGRFWQQDETETVEVATLNNGNTVFVTSAPAEDGKITVVDAVTGKKGFANTSDIVTREVDGEQIQATNKMSMAAFLNGQIAMQRKTEEETRMANERNAQIDALRAQVTPGTRINLGTEGSPVYVFAKKVGADGVTVVDETGMETRLGWDQAADALGQPIVVETDQQKLDAEISARLQRLAERRMQSRIAPATQTATEEAAQETAEAVAQEQKHIPMNEDGTVNEAAFWMQDPEGYVQWNDEQNKDGGQDSLRQIAIAKQELIALLAEAATGQNTSNPTMRKAAEKEVAIIQDKIAQLEAMEQRYAETLVESVKQTAATPTATMNEEQLEQMDAQYQGILSMTRVPSERVRVMQEYLDKLAEGSVQVVLLTKQNYEEQMKADNLPEVMIKRVRKEVEAGRAVAGFMAAGKVYLMDEGVSSINEARVTYIHERQHTFNKKNPELLKRVVDALESREKALEVLKTFVGEGGLSVYESLTTDALADEILAYSMEIAYTTEEFSVDLQAKGIPSEVISIITEINDEQRKDQSLSHARRRRGRITNDNVPGAGSVQENGRDLGQISGGVLESEATRPSGSGGRGTQTGEGAEPGAEVISDGEAENNAAAAQGEGDGLHDDGTAGSGQAEDAGDTEQVSGGSLGLQGAGPYDGGAQGDNGSAGTGVDPDDVAEQGTIMDMANQDDSAIRFSIRTENYLEEQIRAYANSAEGKKAGWTEEKIESIIKETRDLINAIHNSNTGNEFYDDFAVKDPTIRLDWRDGVDKPIVTWTRANIEYKYDMSADLLCINNEGLEAVLSSDKMVALMEMFIPEKKAKKGEPVIKFTADDYLELYNTLKDLGFVVPCKGCFDAAGRFKMLPSVAQKFAAEVNAVIAERNKDPKKFDEKLKAQSGEKTASGLPATSSTKSAAIAVGVAGDNLTEPIKWTQLMSADGQTKMLSDWGGIFRAWQRTGAGRPKDKLLPEPYYGDIVSSHTTIIGAYGESTPSFRDILVNTGTGLRRNSHSEFRPVLAVDEIQFMRDAFIRNLTVFKYMKELDDVRLFGKMGVKYNMSFFPEFVPGTKAAGLDLEGNYIASEESVGSREFPYFDERGVKHYDGMRGFEEAQKHINKDVSLSSVILSIPHLLKALTDVPTPSDAKGIWGSLIPFHSSGATTSSLAAQGLGLARANGVGHGFEEAMYDYGRGVTNFEAVQNDRFGKGWEIISGKKAGTKVEEGHKVEFANGTHYYNRDLGVHLFASGYILDSELPEGALMENGDLNIDAEQKKSLMHKFKVDYNDKVRELGTPYAYKEAADFYLSELPKIGLVPRFDFTVEESVFLQMCADANVDPRHPKLGWKGEGNGWSPIDSEAYYSLFCDFGMTDPATGEWSPHNPVGVVNENGKREFRLPEDTVEIVREGLERFSEVRRAESGKIDEAIKAFAERSVKKGRISKKNAEKVVGKISTSSKKSEGPIDLIDEARKANASDIAFRFVGEKAAQRTDAMVGSAQMISALHTAQQMERQLNPKWSQKKNAEALRIKMATGWEKGVDGLWRYETPDFTYKGKPDGRKEFMLPELIEDDSLFIQYPELKDARVVFADLGDNVSGKTSIDRGSILIEIHERLYRAVNPAWTEAMERFRNEKPEAAKRIGSGNALLEDTYDLNDYVGNLDQYTDQFGGRETMAHEIQHVIQEIEGFALGGGAETFDTHDPQAAQLYGRFKDEVDEVNRLVEESQKIQQKIGLARFVRNTSMEQSLQAQAQQIANEYAIHYVNYQDLERILAGFGILGEDGYERLAGEVESDNVVRRLDMTPEERMQSLIADTQKMDHASQIILRNNLMVDFTEDMLSFRITPRTDEQREKLFEDAKAHYGVTKNFNAAGYMLPDGSLLDFSEANNGGDPNSRSLDHRDIEGIIMDNGVEYDSRWMYIADFMNEGAIRLLPESAGINMIKAPTEEQRKKIFDFIYKFNGEVILEIADERLNNIAYVEYNRRTSPARIFRDIDGYFNEGIVPQQDVRFRVSNENQAIFVSNAAKAVEGIKMEKATPEQWLKMIEKAGGLKAGEDKWMGLSDWLKASDKKTLTKQEVLDFIKENMIQIEETHYSRDAEDDAASQHDFLEQRVDKRYKEILNGLQDIEDYDDRRLKAFKQFQEELGEYAEFVDLERYGVYLTFPYEDLDKHIDMAKAFGVEVNLDNPIHETRRAYTTKGLDNLHEIALTVPTIERWNVSDDIHFGDAGDGRAVAWIRFGETYGSYTGAEVNRYLREKYGAIDYEQGNFSEEDWDKLMQARKQGKKVLVIDEIQSKRHQEGREKGYQPNLEKEYEKKEAIFLDAQDAYINYLKETYNVSLGTASQSEVESLRAQDAKLQDLWEIMKDAEGDLKDVGRRQAAQLSDLRVPDAPFDKNWHELAMKRMLRYAAENGYDAIAWTKGEQQAERYSIGEVISSVEYSVSPDGSAYYVYPKDKAGLRPSSIPTTFESEKEIADVYGKDIAVKIVADLSSIKEEAEKLTAQIDTVIQDLKEAEKIDKKSALVNELTGQYLDLANKRDKLWRKDFAMQVEGTRIGGEGMSGFYDKMLPAFMNKYGKKWGVKVEDIELPNLEEAGQTMHSIPVTEEMKASVMEGQVMFRTTEITPEVRAEMDVIAATAIVNGNYMKAPNGADTNLTAEQWAMVRTKNFKAWFGDWENDPENASKVVDENGEPKVVYHGTPNMFWEFRFNHIDPSNELGGGYYFGTKELAEIYTRPNDDNRHLVDGMIDKFFDEHPDKSAGNIEDFNEAEEWAEQEAFKNARLMPVFLNIRKPFIAKEQDDFFNEFAGYFDTVGQGLWYKGYDGVIDASFYDRHGNDFGRPLPKGTVQYFVVNPSKVKSATDNVGTFRKEEMWQDDDIRFRIGKARKEQMRKGLKTKLTVLSEQEVEKTIDEIEKLGETHKKGGDSKVEKVAFHWVLKGSVILPEDNYKIDEAIKVAERAKVNPMDYDSPMDLITAFKEFESKVPAIDPDTVQEFSNKTELPSGIVVYNVQDDAAGQAAVRKIIDTHWGEDANPWCLAARFGDDLQAAFYYWKQYSKYPKRIAFRNGKLLAFFASQSSKVWWDRKDTPSSGIPYSVKSKDRDFVVTTSFEYDEETGEVREKETVKRNEKKGIVIQYQGKKLVAANVDSQDLVLEYTNFGDKTRTLVSEGKQYVQIRYKEDFELSTVSIVGKNPARYSFINGKLAMIEDRPEGSKRVIAHGEFRSELSLGNGWRLEFDENGELSYAIKGDYRADFKNGEPAYIDVGNMPYAKRIDGQWRDSAFPQYMANPLLNSFISSLHNFLDNHSTKRDDYPQFDMLSNYPSELVEAIKEAEGNLNETVGETVVDTLGLLNSSEIDENEVSFRVVTDPAKIEELENGPKIKVYRAMQLIDGKLYPPMSAKVDGQLRQPIELGQWEEAEERPDLADDKGYFKLDKGNKKSLKARYNPYFHASYTPLNDQFSEAQDRPNLVIVEVEIPVSELTSGYKADKAKDSVGEKEWKAGVIQGKLSGTRKVILSRWDKPVRIVPDSEVADEIVKMFDGKDIVMPSNVVTPSLRAELENRGVPFVETNNQGKKLTNIAEMTTPIWSSKGTFANFAEAEEWAHKNLQGESRVNRYTGERISIGSNSISKMLSPKAQKQSSSISAHLAALKSVLDFIKTGIPAEVHADQEGRDFNVLRLYNAIEIDNKLYRVKSTVRKVRQGDKFYTYEVQEMELIEERWSSQKGEADNPRNPDSPINSITGAKLLKGVKKSNSNENILPESENVSFRVNENPTEAQKEAGNYKMGHLNLDGYRITIENPKGSVRRGTDSKGNAWENTLNNDYGYIRGTEGVDGDHIDVYLSDNPSEGNVFVIDQVNPETREFDEHKVMYGFNSAEEAREAYLANFSEGWNGLGTITEVSKDEFKKWIQSSHRKTKPFSEYKSVNAISSQSEGMEDEAMLRVTGTPTDEVVASGLSLSPAQTADLAGNIFAALPESARAEVTASLNGDILGLQDAIMQIPARLAMKENWDEADKELASVVREKVQDIVDSKGATNRPLTTKEALWMLHNTGDSYDLISAATDAIVARNLGFDPESIRRRKDVDDYIRFRAGSQGAIDAATDMYNYETSLWTERLKESWLDMNQSVVALQNAMSQASGMPIEPWENIVYALNRLSSKSYAEKQNYLRDYLTPLWDAVIRIIKHTDFKIEDIERYMMLKHALERNEIFAKRDAKEFYRNMYDEVAKKMKSQSHAERVVALSEAKKALADIDAQIATASGSELRRLMDQRVNAQYKVDVADLVLRGDETRNEADLQAYYSAIEAGADPKYLEFREKDYSGLTAMYTTYVNVRRSNYKSEEAYQRAVLANQQPIYDNVADMESAARMEVDNFENHMAPEAVTNLWDKVNAATKEVLRHQYESGMITVEQYEAVRDMFEHYVPLRGFADNTAEDMYSYYMNNSSNGFSMPIIGAKGRKTRAESPLGWIGTMAESAIQADNKNEAKMCLYYAVLRRPGQNLLSITDTWFEYSHTENGKKVYKPAYPPQTDRVLNADELRQHMEDWEKDMKSKQAQGKAFKGTQSVNLRGSVIFQDDKQEKEHIIRVKVAGKDYSILINGNPRAAQAINGLLNPDANVGPIKEWMGWARRGLSSLLTSFSPLFWVANYQRDLLSSTMRTSEAYGWYDAMKYLANRRKAWRVASYIYKYQNGTLGDTYYEKLYKEFAENGGITGYTALTSNKEYEKLLADYAKEVRNPSAIKWAKKVFGNFMSFGEAIEQVSRFAAYITARESGKAIEEAVYAAKEVSVNFNRKGSTKPISREELEKLRTKKGEKLNGVQKIVAIVLSAMPSWLKELYFFFNASVQAISSSLKLAAKSPGKAAGWAGAYFGMSIAMAWINYLLGDDDDEYLDLPDYLRHSTVLIKVGDEYYIKWSIPQEMRPFYAWADMIVSKAMGKMPHKSLGKEMALAAAQWLPVNPFESEDPLLSLVPDVASPIVEAVANKTSFGGKIYDDMAFKSEGTVQDIPAYRKATDKTGKVYVELSEILNAISGGDEVQKGWANINPAALEHLVEGYGGGIYDFAKMMVTFPGLVIDAATGEKEMEIKNIPFVNKVVMSVDETNMYSHTNDAFYHYKGIAESAKRIEKEYAESDDPSRAEAYREEEDWRIYLLYKQYEEDFKDVKESLDNAVDEDETDLLKQQQNVLREMFLNDIAKGELPEVTFEIREDIKRIEKDVKKIMKPADDANKERLEKKRAGDVDGMVRAIERRDSLKDTPEYQRAEEISKEVKAIKKKLQELGTVERRSQRDSVIGELQRDYERLKERMSDEISQLP